MDSSSDTVGSETVTSPPPLSPPAATLPPLLPPLLLPAVAPQNTQSTFHSIVDVAAVVVARRETRPVLLAPLPLRPPAPATTAALRSFASKSNSSREVEGAEAGCFEGDGVVVVVVLLLLLLLIFPLVLLLLLPMTVVATMSLPGFSTHFRVRLEAPKTDLTTLLRTLLRTSGRGRPHAHSVPYPLVRHRPVLCQQTDVRGRVLRQRR